MSYATAFTSYLSDSANIRGLRVQRGVIARVGREAFEAEHAVPADSGDFWNSSAQKEYETQLGELHEHMRTAWKYLDSAVHELDLAISSAQAGLE